MHDPLDVRSSGDLLVACQIIHMGWRDDATLIDLVTLEPCWRGTEELPAGTPLTLGFKATHLEDDRLDLEGVLRGWERRGAVLVLEAAGAASGICYQFSDGEEHLLLVLDEQPPQPDWA